MMKRKNLSKRPKPWRAVAIARVSSEGQRDNSSHEVQHTAIKRLCEAEGLDLIETFNEVASGTGYETRVQTQAAIEMIERDEADVLVLYDVTRYGRDVEYQHKILKRIIASGGRLQFALFRLDYDERTGELTPESLQMLSYMGVGAAAELAYIRRRMSEGQEKKRDAGIQTYCTLHPFGWHIVSKTDVLRGLYPAAARGMYEPVEAQLRVVRPLIFEAYASGQSLRDICAALWEAGVSPPRGAPRWMPATVRQILRNPVYMGRPGRGRTQSKRNGQLTAKGFPSVDIREIPLDELQYLQGDNVRAQFARPDIAPLLVPEPLFWKCYALLQENRARLGGPKTARFPLASLLVCPMCGERMLARTSSTTAQTPRGPKHYPGRAQYVCSARRLYRNPDEARCLCPPVRADEMHEMIFTALETLILKPQIMSSVLAHDGQKRKRSPRKTEEVPVESRLTQIEQEEIETVTDRIAARRAGQSVVVYDTLLARLNAERDGLLVRRAKQVEEHKGEPRIELATIRTQIAAMMDALRDEKTSGLLKNQMLCLLFAGIEPIFDAEFVPEAGFRLNSHNSPLVGAKMRLAVSAGLAFRIENGVVSLSTV